MSQRHIQPLLQCLQSLPSDKALRATECIFWLIGRRFNLTVEDAIKLVEPYKLRTRAYSNASGIHAIAPDGSEWTLFYFVA